MESEKKGKSGGVIVEFLIALPLLLILVAFLVNVASFIWEMEMLSDAARHGARVGQRACFQGAAPDIAAANAVNDFRVAHNFKRWDAPTISVSSQATIAVPRPIQTYFPFNSNVPDFDVVVRYLSVGMGVSDASAEACFFCLRENAFLSFQMGIQPNISSSFLLGPSCPTD